MTDYNQKFKSVLIFMAILMVGILIVCFHFSENILSKNKPIPANILIIEGWLPLYALEMIPQRVNLSGYETIIITGMKYKKHEMKIHPYRIKNSKQVFIPNGGAFLNKLALSRLQREDTVHSIKIYSHGTIAMGTYPHFVVFVNDSIIGDGYTANNLKNPVALKLNFPSKKLLKMLIYFDNDLVYNGEDRNLWIDSLKVNQQSFSGNKDFEIIDDRDVNNYLQGTSDSRKTSMYLTYLGIKEPFVVLDTLYSGRNRTRAFAVKCKKWIDKNYPEKQYSINIISINYHSKRTYNTFKSVEKNTPVGIISMPYINREFPYMNSSDDLLIPYVIKESVSLLLNYIY